jgi:hypothetical protein|tara:strand:- start:21 stop:689 length:669 start_codon:yes stop_codon:yes gene_type:complete
MASLNSFADRITDLISSDYTDINSEADLFNAAVAEVADSIPTELLLKYTVDPFDLTNLVPTWTSVEDKKVLLVTRLDASGGFNRECLPVSIQDFEKAKDANSIYLATKHSPVYAYLTDAGATALNIYPTPTSDETVKVYYFAYPTIDITEADNIAGLPDECYQAIVLKACINILGAFISNAVQDEEDSEILAMLSSQIQTLKEAYTDEMLRFSEEGTAPRSE